MTAPHWSHALLDVDFWDRRDSCYSAFIETDEGVYQELTFDASFLKAEHPRLKRVLDYYFDMSDTSVEGAAISACLVHWDHPGKPYLSIPWVQNNELWTLYRLHTVDYVNGLFDLAVSAYRQGKLPDGTEFAERTNRLYVTADPDWMTQHFPNALDKVAVTQALDYTPVETARYFCDDGLLPGMSAPLPDNLTPT